MNSIDRLPRQIQELYAQGCKHQNQLLAIIEDWPRGEYSKLIAFKDIDNSFRENVKGALIDILGWISRLWIDVFQGSLITQDYVMGIWGKVERCVEEAEYVDETHAEVKEQMERILALIVATHTGPKERSPQIEPSSYLPNTAFVLMWMDSNQAELDDICNAIKEVCELFDVRALRSDDVETSDKITDVVLRHIATSEFIIADLTGERPNVYYEVGYAHAMNKRIILYRKKGTVLHFDLAGHNIPEYKNITDLKNRLRKRFENMLGRQPTIPIRQDP